MLNLVKMTVHRRTTLMTEMMKVSKQQLFLEHVKVCFQHVTPLVISKDIAHSDSICFFVAGGYVSTVPVT